MRWINFFFIIVFLVGILYAISMFFVPENKSFTVQKEINYPVEKVFPQFNNLQNFASWNTFFSDNENLTLEFFSPYQGQGSSLTFIDRKKEKNSGDLFIRYANPNRTLKMQLFNGEKNTPYLIDLKFVPKAGKTKMIWFIHTPKQPFLKRSLNLISEDYWLEMIDRSTKNLTQVLGNKIERENLKDNLKFDSVMVEKQESQILLGVNITAKNSKEALFRNIVMNHNKVLNYVKMDLHKKDDEFGEPILLVSAEQIKDKEVTYFYGVALPKKEPISDNNFTFRTSNSSDNLVIYYRGNYANRIKAVQQLTSQATKQSLRYGMLQETFLEEPFNEDNVVLKLSLPVYQ